MVETEIKIPCMTNLILNHPALIVEILVPRHLEDNWLFDFDDRRLQLANRTLRLRQTDIGNWLTFKDSPLPHEWLKIRPEFQVTIDTPDVMKQILEAVGLRKVFRYQKYRTGFRVTLPGKSEIEAVYDETPMGNYLELEGLAESIRETVQLLGISQESLVKSSYPTLWMTHLEQMGISLRDMLFE
jgi:adenylate cyclase class 2